MDDPRLANLCEQWRGAVGEPQTTLAAVETILLLVTICFTAWATVAASRAAKAAKDSVTVAQDTAKKQLRAYVEIEKIKFERQQAKDSPWMIVAIIKNFGQTPAYRVKTRIAYTISDVDPGAFPVQEHELAPADLAPGHIFAIPLILGTRDPKDASFDPFNQQERSMVYAWGSVSYADVFGSLRTTNFRMVHSNPRAYEFGHCKEGNESN